jgi:NAD(P)-dependent dehydrogenase (short-subunit alcohol dehydrogenase family)
MKRIAGRKALVTGAASGIGRSIALALASEGVDVFLVDIDGAGLEETAREAGAFGTETAIAGCDLSQPAQIEEALRSLLERWGKLHILVNNAGVLWYGPTHRMSAAQWRWLLSINLFAPILLIRMLLPTLLAQEEAHIVNVCSMLGLAGGRKVAAYQTSKFALVGLSRGLRLEYRDTGLGVTALCPGFVRTSLNEPFAGGQRIEIPSWIQSTPEAVAQAAIAAIHGNRGVQVVSPAAHLYWTLVRLCPGLVDWVNREGWRQRGMIKSI